VLAKDDLLGDEGFERLCQALDGLGLEVRR
jgi:hypothetical protein